MKELSPRQIENLRSSIDRGEISREEVASQLQGRGYSSAPFDDSLGDDILQELQAFGQGIPEGASFNLFNLGDVEGAWKTEVPFLGEITPSRELGRLGGGALTGGSLFSLGRAAVSPLAGGLVSKFLSATPGRVGRLSLAGAETAGAMVPETMVATSIEVLRGSDLEKIGNTAALWMTLGIGGEALQKVAGRLLGRLRKSKGESTPEIDTDVKEFEARVTGTTMGDATERGLSPTQREGYLFDDPEFSRSRTGEVPSRPEFTESQLLDQADEYRSTTEKWDRQGELAERLAGDRPMLGVIDDAAAMDQMQDDLLRSAMPVLGEDAVQRAERLASSIPVRHTVDLPGGIAARYSKGEILINPELLYKKYDNKAWTKPRIEGVEPLPEDIFPSYRAFESFVHKHEVLHSTVKKLEHETVAMYENRINTLALERLPHGLIGAHPRFKQDGYLIRENLNEPRPLEFKAENLDPKTGLLRMTPRQQQGADTLQRFLGVEDAQARFLMAAPREEVISYLRRRAQMLLEKKPGLDLNRQVSNDAEKVFRARVRYAPELADISLVGGGRPDHPSFLTTAPAHRLDRPSLMSNDPAGAAAFDKRGTISEMVDELHVRGVDVKLHRHIPEVLSNQEADEVLGELSLILQNQRTKEQDAILALFEGKDKGEITGAGKVLGMDPDDPRLNYKPFVDDMKEAGILSKILSPSSRYSLGRNAAVHRAQFQIMDQMEAGQARKGEWTDRLAQIREVVGMPAGYGIGAGIRGTYQRIRHGSRPQDQARERLYQLSQILDNPLDKDLISGYGPDGPIKVGLTGREALAKDPALAQAYQMTRELLSEIADALEIPREGRIANYIAHVFTGRTGRLRARMISEKLGPGGGDDLKRFIRDPEAKRGDIRDREVLEEAARPGTEIPEAKYFKHLLPRTQSLSGFDYDFDTLMMVYLNGASAKITADNIAQYGLWVHKRLPDVDEFGKSLEVKETWAKYMKHVMGSVSSGRQKFTDVLKKRPLYHRAADAMIDWIGMPGDGKTMRQLSMPREQWEQLSPEIRAEYQTGAENYLRELKLKAAAVDPITGKRLETKMSEKLRARMALKIDDIRTALANPELQQPVLQEIYRVQMIAKLGFNAAHGLINLTQTLVNVYPLVDSGYISKGINRFLYKKHSNFRYANGNAPREVLKESGLLDDTAKVEEFIPLLDPTSALKHVQEAALAPSRWSEKFNRGVGVLAAYEQFVDQGLDHVKALQQARQISLKANFPFNVAGTPPLLRTPIMRLMFMFSSYRIHQTSFTADLMGEAMENWGKGNRIKAVEPLAKHLMAYGILLGAGATGYSKTNLFERSQHPAAEAVTGFPEDVSRRGLLGAAVESISGPFADTLLDVMHWRIAEAAAELAIPSTLTRIAKEGMPDSPQDVIKLLGLKAYNPKKKKKPRMRSRPKGMPRPGQRRRRSY